MKRIVFITGALQELEKHVQKNLLQTVIILLSMEEEKKGCKN